MRFICENGHVRNLANFDTLLGKILAYGKQYKPSNAGIQFEALIVVSQNAKAAIYNVTFLTKQYDDVIRVKEQFFHSLEILNQNLFKTLKSTTNISEIEMYMLAGRKYASQLKNFSQLIKLLKADPCYLPKDNDLSIAKLEEFYNKLVVITNTVKQHQAWLDQAYIIQNEVMYRNHYGLVALSIVAKVYIKYHFGWDSSEFKEVSGLVIKKVNKHKNP